MHAFFSSLSAHANTSPSCILLPDHQVFVASGEDAASFLHGQLTQDITHLPEDGARFAGYCTAKGRLLATLLLWRNGMAEPPQATPAITGLVRADVAPALLKRLSMFVLRAKVSFSTPLHYACGVIAPRESLSELENAIGGTLPQQPWQRVEHACGTWIAAPSAAPEQLRWWWITSDAHLANAGTALSKVLTRGAAESAVWRSADLAAGLPWIGLANQDTFIPQTVNLDLIGAVNFTKGCYPGQEIVARSHYRGTVKRRMAYGLVQEYSTEAADALVGKDIYDAGQPTEPCGRVIDVAQSENLTVLFEIALSALPDGDLRLGSGDGPRIRVLPLPYAIAP